MNRLFNALVSLGSAGTLAGIYATITGNNPVDVYSLLLWAMIPVLFLWRRETKWVYFVFLPIIIFAGYFLKDINLLSENVKKFTFPLSVFIWCAFNVYEIVKGRNPLLVIFIILVPLFIFLKLKPEMNLSIILILTLIFFWTYSERWFVKSIRLFPHLHFFLLPLAGGLIGGSKIFNPALLLSALSILSSWTFTLTLNDIYDVDIDRISNPQRPLPSGICEEWQLHEMSFISGLIALGISIIPKTLFHVLTFLFLGFIYSSPPLRLRKYPLGSIFIALGSIIGFHAGYFSVSGRWWEGEIIKIIAIIFFAFSFGIIIKDLKDVEGDRAAGVRTFYTMLGKERGLMVTPFFLLLAFFSPLFLLHSLYDILIYFFFWLASVIFLFLFRHYFYVFPFYLAEFIYVLVRYINIR